MPNQLSGPLRTSAFLAVLAGAVPALAPGATLWAQDAAPPAASPADSTRVQPAVVKHTVKTGDTLWDIARYYLKDPFLWPQVFHANTDIVKNPHWIYPGQVLSIDGAAVKPEVAARASTDGFVVSEVRTQAATGSQTPTIFADQQTSALAENRRSSIEKAQTLTVRPGEYAAAPYLVAQHGQLGAGRILGAVETLALGLHSDAGFRFKDRLYVTAPAGAALHPGATLVVGRLREEIPDVGRVFEPTGIVRVDSVSGNGPAIAVLEGQFGAVTADQLVVVGGEQFVPTTVRPVDGSYGVSSSVLWIQNNPRLPSLQSYVIIGADRAAGVRAGDQFTLLDSAPAATDANALPIPSALVKIVRVNSLGATGIIVDQTQPRIRAGMPARLTAKMP